MAYKYNAIISDEIMFFMKLLETTSLVMKLWFDSFYVYVSMIAAIWTASDRFK